MDSLALFQSMQGNVNPIEAYAAGSRIANQMLQVQAQQGQQVFENLFRSAQQNQQSQQFEQTMAMRERQFQDESARGWFNAETQRSFSRDRLAQSGQPVPSFDPYVTQVDGERLLVTPSSKGQPQYSRIPKTSEERQSFDIPPGFTGQMSELTQPPPDAASVIPVQTDAEAVRLEQGGISIPQQDFGVGPNPLLPGIPGEAPAPANFPPTQQSIPPASVITAPPRQMGQPAQLDTPAPRQMGQPAPMNQRSTATAPSDMYPSGEPNAFVVGDVSGAVKTWTQDGKKMAQRARRTSSGLTWDAPYMVDERTMPAPIEIGGVKFAPLPMPNNSWSWREIDKPKTEEALTPSTEITLRRDLEGLETDLIDLESRLSTPVPDEEKVSVFKLNFGREPKTTQDWNQAFELATQKDKAKIEAAREGVRWRREKLGLQEPTAPATTAPTSSIGRQYLNRVTK